MFSLNHLSLDLIRFSFCRMWEFCRRGTWWRTMNRAGLNIFNDHFVFFDSFFTWILLCNCQASAWQLRLAMLLSHELAHAVDNPELVRQHVRQSRRACARFTTMATRVWTFWPRPTRPDAQRSAHRSPCWCRQLSRPTSCFPDLDVNLRLELVW